ncbi:MAG: glutathione synthase [bacterium]
MRFVFLMDPIETIVYQKDTTYALMCAANLAGHSCYYLAPEGILLGHQGLRFILKEIMAVRGHAPSYKEDLPIILDQDEIHALFIRLDPPFNSTYMTCTWLLDRLPSKVFVCNNPNAVRTAQEKTWLLQFPDLVPPTLIASNCRELLNFSTQFEQIVLKPYDQFAGHGVFSFSSQDSNLKVAIEVLTNRGTNPCILQPFIPEADTGDKRILLLNGEPLGAVLRKHSATDHRNNFFAGGEALPCTLNERDYYIIHSIKETLKKLGLYFVGIDILGDYLVEINVTSPTCLQEMMALENKDLSKDVIEFVYSRCKR